MPLVSVVMPVYNGARFLAQAIESILTQTFTDFELIIVDDGSQDRSAEIIRQYAERDERVRFIQLERNVGMASARNHGLAAATGAYITNMDDDDISLPERLEKQVAFLKAHPEIGALGAGSRLVKQDLTPIRDLAAPQDHCLIVLDMFIGNPFIGATVMFRRELLAAAGGYEPGRRHADDLELFSRMVTRTRYANLPGVLLLIRKHERHQAPRYASEKVTAALEIRIFMLLTLWDETPEGAPIRLWRMRFGFKFGWAEYRQARRDLQRLIDAMIEAKWAEPGDRAQMEAHAARCLERTTPRLWQMLCHWRRHRFGRRGPRL